MLVNVISDFQHAAAGLSHVNSNRCSFCTFYSFWMVVRHFSNQLRKSLCFFQTFCCETNCANSHSGTISVAVIWLRIVGKHPAIKTATVSAIRIVSPDTLHTLNRIFRQIAVVRFAYQDCLRNSQTHDTIICSKTFVSKEIKLLAPVVIPFKTGSNDIPDNSS